MFQSKSKSVRTEAEAHQRHYRHFMIMLGAFLGLFIIMAVGYYLIEGFSIWQSWLAFVSHNAADWFEGRGAEGIPAQSTLGKVFSSFTALASLVIGGYFISVLTSFIVDGQLREYLKVNTMDKEIAKLEDHFIICGADDTTREILEELTLLKKPLVVVYPDCKKIEQMGQDILYLDADPTIDQTLIQAGIERARGFISSLDTDQENLFLTISARALSPKIHIIAKVFDDDACLEKLKKAGANDVVSPFSIGGMRIASILVRPTIVGYLDTMLKHGRIRFDEIILRQESKLVGKTIAEANFFNFTGLNIVSLKKKQIDTYIYNIPPDTKLEAEDTLIVIGTPEEVIAASKKIN